MKGRIYIISIFLAVASVFLTACSPKPVRNNTNMQEHATPTPTPKVTLNADDEKGLEMLRKNPASSKFFPHWQGKALDEIGFDGVMQGVDMRLPQSANRKDISDVIEKSIVTCFLSKLSPAEFPIEKCFVSFEVLYPSELVNNSGGRMYCLVQADFAAFGFLEGEIQAQNLPPATLTEATPSQAAVTRVNASKSDVSQDALPAEQEAQGAQFSADAAFVRHINKTTFAILDINVSENGEYDIVRFIEPVEFNVPLFSPELTTAFPIEVLADASGRNPETAAAREHRLYTSIREQADAYVQSLGRETQVADAAQIALQHEDIYELLWLVRPDFAGLHDCGAEMLVPSAEGTWRVKNAVAVQASDNGARVTLMREWSRGADVLISRWVYDYDREKRVFVQVEAQQNDPAV